MGLPAVFVVVLLAYPTSGAKTRENSIWTLSLGLLFVKGDGEVRDARRSNMPTDRFGTSGESLSGLLFILESCENSRCKVLG